MQVDELAEGFGELFLATLDHVHLAQVGRKTQAVKLRAGRKGAANVPGVSGATERTVNQVQRIGNRIQHHARTAEDAGALAHRACHALLVAV